TNIFAGAGNLCAAGIVLVVGTSTALGGRSLPEASGADSALGAEGKDPVDDELPGRRPDADAADQGRGAGGQGRGGCSGRRKPGWLRWRGRWRRLRVHAGGGRRRPAAVGGPLRRADARPRGGRTDRRRAAAR